MVLRGPFTRGEKVWLEETAAAHKGEPLSSQDGGCLYTTPPPPGTYGAPPYSQPAGVPTPVYTYPTPVQPCYPQQQPDSASYSSAPPPAAYPYQQQEVPVKPSVLGKPDSLPEDLERNAANTDASANAAEITPDLDVSIRHAFVRKVYCILATQILLTFGTSIAFTLSKTLAQWMVDYWWISIVGAVISLVCVILITCVQSLGRRFPLNMVLLTLITLGVTSSICYGAATTSSYSFFLACAITSAVVIALTIFAVQVKYDFTGWGPFVLVICVVLIFFSVSCIVFRNRILSCVYAGISAVFFSFLLVYDTQQVVGGKHRKYQYSVDDYVFAALTLYLDIISLFMEVLSLLNNA